MYALVSSIMVYALVYHVCGIVIREPGLSQALREHAGANGL